MDCSLPGSSVHGNFQARIWEWFAISYTRGFSQPRGQTRISCVSYMSRQILYHWATWGNSGTMQDVLTCIVSFYPSPMEIGTIIPILQLWKQRLEGYGARICWLKILCTMCDLWVKFYLGQNEDYSLRDSISNISEELLRRGSGGVSIYVILVKGVYMRLSTHFGRNLLSHEEQMSLWMILMLL